jgi:hypothetical protein
MVESSCSLPLDFQFFPDHGNNDRQYAQAVQTPLFCRGIMCIALTSSLSFAASQRVGPTATLAEEEQRREFAA